MISMAKSGYGIRNPGRRIKAVAAIMVYVGAVAGLCPGISAQTPEFASPDAGPIRITADELISQMKKNFAEFIGNVEAVQGDFEIRSDRLRIHYRRSDGQKTPNPTSGDAIEKIVAIGQVRIKSGNRRAKTERAEYFVDKGLLVMKGKNSTITEGDNSIIGSVITFNRLSGEISVEGGPSGRVRAVFHSSGRELTRDKSGKPRSK